MRPDEATLARRLMAEFGRGDDDALWQAVARFVLEREEELRAEIQGDGGEAVSDDEVTVLAEELWTASIARKAEGFEVSFEGVARHVLAREAKLRADLAEARRLLATAEESDANGVTMYVRVSDENAKLRAENEKLRAANGNLVAQMNDTDTKADQIRSAWVSMSDQYAKLRDNNEKLREENARLDEECSRLRADLAEARRLLGVAEEADANGVTMYVRVSDENARLREEITHLTSSFSQTQEIAERLRDENARLRAELTQWTEAWVNLGDEHAKLRASVETLNRSQRQYERENGLLRAMLLAALNEGVSTEWDAKVRTLLEGENE